MYICQIKRGLMHIKRYPPVKLHLYITLVDRHLNYHSYTELWRKSIMNHNYSDS